MKRYRVTIYYEVEDHFETEVEAENSDEAYVMARDEFDRSRDKPYNAFVVDDKMEEIG